MSQSTQPSRIFTTAVHDEWQPHPLRVKVRALNNRRFQVLSGLLAGQDAVQIAESCNLQPPVVTEDLEGLLEHFETPDTKTLVALFHAADAGSA